MTDRFRELRGRERAGEVLSGSEAAELAAFYAALYREEEALLAPATARVKEEADALARTNVALRSLLEREESFANRLETLLVEVKQERLALQAERERLASVLERAA
jgi:hypothetical protein